jgi:hypothetical protein
MYTNRRMNMNRFRGFISKIKKRRRPRHTVPTVQILNIGIESAVFAECLSQSNDAAISTTFDSIGVKFPATIHPSMNVPASNEAEAAIDKPKTIKNRSSKICLKYYTTHGESMKNFPVSRQHCLFDESNPGIAYFLDATLYSIPEHGAGICQMRYATVYQHGAADIWSVNQSNDRPHHRRSSIVYCGI